MPSADPGAPRLSLAADHPPLLEVGGRHMSYGLRTSLSWLQANQEVVNDLNVFPVPDGDTGSNMYLTLRSAVEDAQKEADSHSAAAVMQAAAHGSLMGARGNSGVILSQILRGFAQGLAGSPRVDAAGVAAALQEAQSVAYKAVMKPTEGTILTVVREAAAAARVASDGGGDIRAVLDAAVREAHAAVERTPDMLAVLRDAGVVDAGGFGFAIILEGFARALAEAGGDVPDDSTPLRAPRRVGEPAVRPPGHAEVSGAPAEGRRGAAAVEAREEGWGYCTEFLVEGPGLDYERLRDELGALGESSLVVGDADLVRVHIHTHDPAALIAAAARRGKLAKLKVEDMSAQHHDVLERASATEASTGVAAGAGLAEPRKAVAARKPLGVVSVAPGAGFRQILEGLGVDRVVEGGQTMNPSIEDLLNAARAINADAVILLPNNKNVILTAQQVDQLAEGIAVHVVPTKNLPQGISALLSLDPTADAESNCERMEEAMQAVHSLEVTRAVRDSTANGKEIKTGDVIAVLDGKITAVGAEELAVIDEVLASLDFSPELVTVYRGDAVSAADGDAMVGALREKHGGIEFELHDGGQEHYPYILSLE
ncbi:MAG TPA: DAK2 domain-containing protein [Candidatus Angelobacter sp.]|nr:DAK2 domain-containing protein [Candidatus Angelobacter sp.]